MGRLAAAALAIAIGFAPGSARAASLSFSANGTNAATGTSLVAWANFIYNGGSTMTVQVINGSGLAVASTDVLDAVFWQRNDSAALSANSASATGKSYIWNKPANYNIGSDWQFKSGITGVSGVNEGIGSAPYGTIFSKGNFSTTGNSLSGVNGGIMNGFSTKAPDTLTTATLVDNEVTFTINVGTGFSLNDLTNVYFQFGTSLSGPRLLATMSAPEPGSIALFGTGLFGVAGAGLSRLRRRRARR